MNYDFSRPYGKTSVTFKWSADVTIHPDGRERIKALIAEGCSCRAVEPPEALLCVRTTNGSPVVWLQCSACGGAVGTALKRAHHPGWEKYRPWDESLRDRYDVLRDNYYTARHEEMREQSEAQRSLNILDMSRAAEARQEQLRQRRMEYAAWLRNSPEWHALRDRVQWRSRGFCEACLEMSAVFVHHLTYRFGKIPPAWQLRAVCEQCHARLHDGGDDWCDYGMARDDGE